MLNAPLEENEIILTRRLTRAGRSHAYVNDQPVAVSTLRQVGGLLVDVHGQRENESLLQPAYQLQLLDAFGGLERPRQAYLEQAEKVRELRRGFAALSAARQQRQRELALIRFEREELDQAALEPGELADKGRERERLAHAQSLQTFAEQAAAQLYDEDGSVVERLGRLHREAQGWAALDPGLEEVVRRLEETQSEVQDVTRTLRKLAQHWEADPQRLEEVEQRIQFLKRLETKYRRSIDDLIVYRIGLDEQETRLQKDEDDLGGIQTELAGEYAKLKTAAADLSKQRKKAAKRLAAETQKELADLGMAEARLDAVLEPLPLGDDPAAAEIHAWGADQSGIDAGGQPRRAGPAAAQGGVRRRAVADHAGDQDGAGRPRPARHAGLRRDRRQRRRPAGRRAGPEAGGAGPDASGGLRDAPAAGGQLRPLALDHPQGARAAAGRSRRSRRSRTRTVWRNWPACCAANRAAKPRARKRPPCWRRRAAAGESR